MNYAVIVRILSWVLRTEGLLMLLPCIISLIYGEHEGMVFLVLGVAAMAVGYILSKRKIANESIYQREGFVSVGLSWIVLSLYGALPFVLTGEIPNYLDALFEIVSGFTTTGSSILSNVEALSHTTLFWRSFSHWIGGMGVLVFILMLVPAGSGGTQMNLMRAESPGPDVSKFVPRVRNTAIVLYRIYLGMTLLQILCLAISGMNWFHNLCITFGTAGTGGFGILNASCAPYTPVQQWIITIFMIAFGVNFSFYYLSLTRNFSDAIHMEEVRAYIAIIIFAGLAIAWQLRPRFFTLEETLRAAFFQVGSIMTTTGFSTTDFDLWPSFSKSVLVALMVCGACAGSTGGGMKVSRVVLIMKAIRYELIHLLHPHGVQKIRMDGKIVAGKILDSMFIYIAAYFLIFSLSVVIVSLDNFGFTTNFTAVAATLNNIGPGLAAVGPTRNFAGYGVLSKIVLIFDMLAGRLELLPILILFYPGTWSNRV
ncbi:MAG: TrkH family potassium uptake protein [Acidaminococcus sp.]|jgi:trk system potassium uptake protein TrkH|nr:TrkH family potassium uptake protein [Acidaminococcus sp.]MCI2100641.1 TrkH family potassium uptake protein [Acidaminococcus sp.]MCI2114961.1 TrkH family potassium uptake protein [Acidaminococcus sp.]MCI2117019.1 TrkH family potassium uptake protein [Acidaminococcus sp.]